MPVWHQETKALRESGKLVMIGLTQEQHPQRCRLFAQWQGIDWPILWDPFNLTDTVAVPRATLIDEHGVVRSMRFNPRTVEGSFLDHAHPAPATPLTAPKTDRECVAELDDVAKHDPARPYYEALSQLLWRKPTDDWKAIDALTTYAKAHPDDAAAVWRLGVAERMRFDSPERKAGDFQAALTHWAAGLKRNPRQYIYRRRIQQYGPRLDKPYPFYPWVAEAREALTKRGETPQALEADLSGSELAGRKAADAAHKIDEPDPKGEIPTRKGLVEIVPSIAWHTSPRKGDAARVHLRLVPVDAKALTWDTEAGPARLYLKLPKGWTTDSPNVNQAHAVRANRDASVAFDFELRSDGSGALPAKLEGYALYYACLAGSDECVYLRHEFTVPIEKR